MGEGWVIVGNAVTVCSRWTLYQKSVLPQLIRHNFTNSQYLLIISGSDRPYTILNWLQQKFSNWLRTSCMLSITVVSSHIWTANYWADVKQRIVNRATNSKTIVGLCQGGKTAQWTLCLKDSTFLLLWQHQLWNKVYLTMVTTSAGTLL